MSKSNWDASQVPEQTGRIAVVTGSSSGIGYEAARVLANKGAEVIIAVRNTQKGQAALNSIKAQNDKGSVSVMALDLANLDSIKNFAVEFKKNYQQLDLLINNAGVMIPPYSKTSDGFELQFGTNHLGHFALTLQLLDILNQTNDSRIINVSSNAHKAGKLDLEDLNWEKRKYKAWAAYADSKIANLYFTFKLQKKLQAAGSEILVTAAHPGWTATDLQRHSGLLGFLNGFFAMKIEQGTLPTLRAAVDSDAKGSDYFGPDGFQEWKGFPVKVESNKLSKNETIAGKLWAVSEKLTKTRFNI